MLSGSNEDWIHTSSTLDMSKGFMYSKPSNSVWSIVPNTSLWGGGGEEKGEEGGGGGRRGRGKGEKERGGNLTRHLSTSVLYLYITEIQRCLNSIPSQMDTNCYNT